jgi:hypothetical protein
MGRGPARRADPPFRWAVQSEWNARVQTEHERGHFPRRKGQAEREGLMRGVTDETFDVRWFVRSGGCAASRSADKASRAVRRR